MTATHLHLLLNHVPVFGSVVGLILLVLGRWRKSEELKKTAFGFFAAVPLLSIPVYLTGEPAEDTVKPLPGVSEAVVEQHEEAASVAFGGVIVMGVAGFVGLMVWHDGRVAPGWYVSTMLGAAMVVATLVGWTAHLGGQVRHTEIRSGQNTSSGGGPAQSEHHDD